MPHVDAPTPEPLRRLSGTRRPLDRERILSEAVNFIDEHGLPYLTMRRLGAHLGVEAMALYRYVPGREQLLDAVVDRLMDELYLDTMLSDPPHGWQDYVQQMAHGVRRLATAHPRIFPLVASRPPTAPWLRPPLRSLRWVEAFLHRLRSYGFGPEATVAVYRSFATYLLGALLLEVATLADEAAAAEQDSEGPAPPADQDLAEYPNVTELADLLQVDTFDTEFEDSLEDLINRIDILRS